MLLRRGRGLPRKLSFLGALHENLLPQAPQLQKSSTSDMDGWFMQRLLLPRQQSRGLDLHVFTYVPKQLEDKDPQRPVLWGFRALLLLRGLVFWRQATKQAACGH